MHSKNEERHEDEPWSETSESELEADFITTNCLSRALDEERNEILIRRAYISNGEDRLAALARLLSLDPVIDTGTATSISAELQQAVRENRIGFRKIGFGQCGLVFERPGRGVVVKVARPGFQDALLEDYDAHKAVYQAFSSQKIDPECKATRVFSHANQGDDWWLVNQRLFPEQPADFPLPSSALTSEQILPLPKVIRQLLIDKFCPEIQRKAASDNPLNQDCLARVYLRRRLFPRKLSVNFTLRNFNLFLDQMLELDLHVTRYAGAIGEALAIIHWAANVDGYDIEFVLGSEAAIAFSGPTRSGDVLPSTLPHPSSSVSDTKERALRLWVLDYNLCSRWEERIGWEHPEALIQELVMAFFENDPYYPLPLMEDELDQSLWLTFSNQYLRKAEEILASKDTRLQRLPVKFIEACIERERGNLDNGMGHGHRDHKG